MSQTVEYNNTGRDYFTALNELVDQSHNTTGFVEVFVNGGIYNYQKASLNTRKLLENGEMSSLLQINVPIEESVAYTVHIPRRLN